MTTTFNAINEAEILLAKREDAKAQKLLSDAIKMQQEYEVEKRKYEDEVQKQLVTVSDFEKSAIRIFNDSMTTVFNSAESKMSDEIANLLEKAKLARRRLAELSDDSRPK